MKRKLQIILSFIAIAAISFTGCKEDDKEEPSNPIVGKWEAESASYKVWENDVLKEQNTIPFPAGKLLVEFKSDKTYVSTSIDDTGKLETETGTYSINGNKITVVSPSDDGQNIGEFSISNNKLTIIEKGEEFQDNIKYRWEEATVFKKK